MQSPGAAFSAILRDSGRGRSDSGALHRRNPSETTQDRLVSSRLVLPLACLLDICVLLALIAAGADSWDIILPQEFRFDSSFLDLLTMCLIRLMYFSLLSPGKMASTSFMIAHVMNLSVFAYIIIKASLFSHDNKDPVTISMFPYTASATFLLSVLASMTYRRWRLKEEFLPIINETNYDTSVIVANSIDSIDSWAYEYPSSFDSSDGVIGMHRQSDDFDGFRPIAVQHQGNSSLPSGLHLSNTADHMIKIVSKLMMENVKNPLTGWQFTSEEDGIHTFAKWLPPVHSTLNPRSPGASTRPESIPLVPIVRTVALVNAKPIEVYEIMQSLRLEWDILVGVADGDNNIIQHMQTVDDDTDIVRLRFKLSGSHKMSIMSPGLRELYLVRRWWRSEDGCTFAYGQCSASGFRPQSRNPHTEARMYFGGCIIQSFPKAEDTQAGANRTRSSSNRIESSIITFFYQMDLKGWLPKKLRESYVLHQPVHLWHLRHAIWKRYTQMSPEFHTQSHQTNVRRKKRHDSSPGPGINVQTRIASRPQISPPPQSPIIDSPGSVQQKQSPRGAFSSDSRTAASPPVPITNALSQGAEGRAILVSAVTGANIESGGMIRDETEDDSDLFQTPSESLPMLSSA